MKIVLQQYRNQGDEEIVSLKEIKNINMEQLQRLIEESVVSIDRIGRAHLHIGSHAIEVEYEQEGEFNFVPIHAHFLREVIKDVNIMDFFINGRPLDIAIYTPGEK